MTTLKEFVQYIEENKISSGRVTTRLLRAFKDNDFTIYDRANKEYLDDIRDITGDMLLFVRTVGKKSKFEFEELKEKYLEYLNKIQKDNENNIKCFVERKIFSCRLRNDILKTLETMGDQISFIESALLDKLEKDGIDLVE